MARGLEMEGAGNIEFAERSRNEDNQTFLNEKVTLRKNGTERVNIISKSWCLDTRPQAGSVRLSNPGQH